MENNDRKIGFIPPHGGYENLKAYKQAEYIYDATIVFTSKYFKLFDRTVDQMVQAARSGKQNIVEGSMVSATSKEMELKLTGVARASLAELRTDYEDFLRRIKAPIWEKNHRYANRLKELLYSDNVSYETLRPAIEHPDPAICANAILSLIKATSFMLKRLLERLEHDFIHCGGLKENMFKARLEFKKNNSV